MATRDTTTQIVGTPIYAETAHTITNMLANALEQKSPLRWSPAIPSPERPARPKSPPTGGYDPDNINASFIGWGPVDDPRFLVYVWLEKPQSNKAASVVAAPIFKQVIEKLIVLMDIPPDGTRMQIPDNEVSC